ncbi:MAG: deoxyribose-phosphate aldolase [candidate division Zixibacteria bacterium]|nr:deoxyribose-phosphate aldolase [candidate division Zixibacteria bacterium]
MKKSLEKIDLAGMIDHTLLKPETTPADIKRLCGEGIEYEFASICVNPVYVRLASEELKGSKVKVCSVSGFPLGANRPEIKAKEAERGCRDGAAEIDMVMNLGALKSGDYHLIEDEIKLILEIIGKGKILKVILETCILTREEKIKGAQIVKACGAHFVKTSTGFGPAGATVEDVSLLRKIVGQSFGVKASGGIRDQKSALELIHAGANRIGTSSGIKIIEEHLKTR